MKLLILSLFLMNFSYAQRVLNPKFQDKVNDLIEDLEGKVISVEELRPWTEAVNASSHFQFLDAREKDEFKVSHLPSALHVGYDDFEYDEIKRKLDKNKIQIVYCSVGYRSGKIAEKLKDKGYKVYNLFGGIFEWSNRKLPLMDNKNKPTKRVHTYSSSWAKWLDFGEKVN